MVVGVKVAIQVFLHLFNRLVPSRSACHTEVLVQQGAMQAFDEAIALRPPHTRDPVRDAFQLQRETK